jgi:2'-5' RNA ligase
MDACADALSPFATLDPIPERWRHITMQGLGHVEDVSDAQRDAAVQAVSERVSGLDPIDTTFQRTTIFREAVTLFPAHPEPFVQLRSAVRAGIADAWGSCPENADDFRAHASVAYGNGEAPTAPIREALDQVAPAEPVTARFAEISLIRMHRDRRMYEWETVARVRVGG